MTIRNRSGDAPKAAAELMAELEQDPDFVARNEQRKREQEENIKEYRQAAAPVLAALSEIGFNVDSIGDLRRMRIKYERAVPVLLQWLPEITDPRVKEDIVRTLSVPWAQPCAARPLINEFERVADPTGTDLRWAIGNALEVVADESVLDELLRLAADRRYGRAREMVVLGLGKMKDPRAVNVLIDLLFDEEVAGHAVMALGKLRATAARTHVERFLNHPKTWVRKEAKKALASIDKAKLRRQ
jgi:hypothetical protein